MSTIRAIYENGVFRPIEPVDLPEHTPVEFEPRPMADATDQEKDRESWGEEFRRLSLAAKGNSKGWKFNRDDIYAERLDRIGRDER